MKHEGPRPDARAAKPPADWLEPELAPALHVEPIGFLRSGKRTKFALPHQPIGNDAERNVVELLPGKQFEQAVRDLEGFERIWLVSWFHRNRNWKPQVLPPRGKPQKRGVFATRSPHRPNPIGLTPVELLRVEKRRLVVGEVDLVDGTPILDIKPYLPANDSFPGSRAGWVDELEREQRAAPRFRVVVSALAEAQDAFLCEAWGIEVLQRAVRALAVDPTPHRTRRIRRVGEELLMSCGAWRVYFTVAGEVVDVRRIEPGYPHAYLVDPAKTRIADRAAQLAFGARWSEAAPARRAAGESVSRRSSSARRRAPRTRTS